VKLRNRGKWEGGGNAKKKRRTKKKSKTKIWRGGDLDRARERGRGPRPAKKKENSLKGEKKRGFNPPDPPWFFPEESTNEKSEAKGKKDWASETTKEKNKNHKVQASLPVTGKEVKKTGSSDGMGDAQPGGGGGGGGKNGGWGEEGGGGGGGGGCRGLSGQRGWVDGRG